MSYYQYNQVPGWDPIAGTIDPALLQNNPSRAQHTASSRVDVTSASTYNFPADQFTTEIPQPSVPAGVDWPPLDDQWMQSQDSALQTHGGYHHQDNYGYQPSDSQGSGSLPTNHSPQRDWGGSTPPAPDVNPSFISPESHDSSPGAASQPGLVCMFSDSGDGSVCGRTFTSQTNLKKHQRCHQKDVRCEIEFCDTWFPAKREMRKHIETNHTPAEDRPKFTCPLCPTTFTDDKNRRRHIKRQHRRPWLGGITSPAAST